MGQKGFFQPAVFLVAFIALSPAAIFDVSGWAESGPEVVVPDGSGVHPPCADSDGGKNYFVQGTTKGSWQDPEGGGIALIASKTDFCDGHNKLAEYYCRDTYNMGEERLFCPAGSECKGGACVPKIPAACNDTDADEKFKDGGNYFVGGVCTSTDGEENKDACVPEEDGDLLLKEYRCLPSGGCYATALLPCKFICYMYGKGYAGECKTDQFGLGYCECSANAPQGTSGTKILGKNLFP